MGEQGRPVASRHRPAGHFLRTMPGVSPLTTSGRKPQTRGRPRVSIPSLCRQAEWPWGTLVLLFIVQLKGNQCRGSLGPLAVTAHRPGTKAHSYYRANDLSQPFPESERVRRREWEGQGRGLGGRSWLGGICDKTPNARSGSPRSCGWILSEGLPHRVASASHCTLRASVSSSVGRA